MRYRGSKMCPDEPRNVRTDERTAQNHNALADIVGWRRLKYHFHNKTDLKRLCGVIASIRISGSVMHDVLAWDIKEEHWRFVKLSSEPAYR